MNTPILPLITNTAAYTPEEATNIAFTASLWALGLVLLMVLALALYISWPFLNERVRRSQLDPKTGLPPAPDETYWVGDQTMLRLASSYPQIQLLLRGHRISREGRSVRSIRAEAWRLASRIQKEWGQQLRETEASHRQEVQAEITNARYAYIQEQHIRVPADPASTQE